MSGPASRERIAMVTHRRVYRSFLLRIWRSANGEERVEVEQIQTAETARFASCVEVPGWIEARQAAALADEEHECRREHARDRCATETP
jgi:hypothetical protein